MYEIVISKSAAKDLRKLPSNWQKRILDKIKLLAENPYARNNNVKRLAGTDSYRLRIGDYRVIYQVDDDTIIITVLNIGPRGGVYQ